MSLARHQFFVMLPTGPGGSLVPAPGAEVEVRREDTGALPQLYSDYAGLTTKGNPFTADTEGFAFFHVSGGLYRIKVSLGSLEAPEQRYVGIGLSQAGDTLDAGVVLPLFTAAGSLTVASGDRGYRIKRDTPETADINLPAASTRAGLPFTVVDEDGSFEAYPQTIKFAEGDTGRGATSVVLDSNRQVTTFYPQDDDTWIVG